MSASREKQKRTDLKNSPDYKPPKKEKQFPKWAAVLIKTCIVLVIVAAVCWGILTSGVLFAYIPAATVGGENISIAEYNFFMYNNASNYRYSMQSYYGNSMDSYLPDMSKPLRNQKASMSDGTWADYFKDQTVESLQELISMCQRATAAGITLDAEDQKTIDSYLNSIKDYASQTNTGTAQLLSQTYGKGVNSAVYRKAVARTLLAQKYQQKFEDEMDFSSAALETYYDSHSSDVDEITFRLFTLNATATVALAEGEEEVSAEAQDAADAALLAEVMPKAEDIVARVNAGEDFNQVAKLYAEADDTRDYNDPKTLLGHSIKSNLTTDMADWLYDPARTNNEVGILEVKDGEKVTSVQVIQLLGRERGEYNMVNVRHLLVDFILPEGAEEGAEPTEADKEATRQKAEEYLKMYEDGDKTEDSFAALATEYTTDTGSQENGGLYENVAKGDMVAAFDSWIFDPARQPGDTGLVETNYGYHVMYFVGQSVDIRWEKQVKDSLRTQYDEALLADIKANTPAASYPVSTFFAG